MPDTRSALAVRRAPRVLRRGVDRARDRKASSAMRSTRSFWLPSFSWKVMPASAPPSRRAALSGPAPRRTWRRDSRRGSPSRCRRRSRRPPSLACRFDTSRKRLASFLVRGVAQREALLVLLHRQHQAFGRHLEERLVEVPHQHERPFGQPGVLGQQRLVLDQGELVLLGERARLPRRSARPARLRSRMTLWALRPLT